MTQWEAALRAAHEWHAAPSLDALPEIVLTGLVTLVEADAVGWNEYDLATGRLRALVIPDEGMTRDLSVLERWAHQHPLIQAIVADPLSSPIAISDFLGRRQFHRLDLYHEFFQPHEIEYQMSFGVGTSAPIGVAFNRSTRDFTKPERELLDALRPHIALAHAQVAAREESEQRLHALERGLEAAGRHVVVLDESGRIDHIGPHALAALARYTRDSPGELAARVDGVPLVLHGAVGTLTVRRVHDRPHLLLLDETRPPSLDAGRAANFGLTRRELDVLELVALHRTSREIADALVLSERTVEKHVEHALEKLGVHSRRAAVELLAA